MSFLRSTHHSQGLTNAIVSSLLVAFLSVLLSSCGGQSASSSSSSSSSGSNPSPPPADTPATITSQPKSVEVTYGEPATFTVKATGTAPLNYQWMQNGTKIEDATNSTYTTPATIDSDSGLKFTVSVSNAVAEVMSKPATLTVTTPTIGGPSHAVFAALALFVIGGANAPAVTATFSSPVPAGFLLACGISDTTSVDGSNFTDSDNDTFTVLGTTVIVEGVGSAPTYAGWCAVAPTTGGSNFSVVAPFDYSVLGPSAVFSYSGSSGILLQQTDSSGFVPESTQTLFDSGSLVPTSSGQLAVGVAFVLDMFTGAGNGWTARHAEQNMIVEDAATGTGVETAAFYSTYTQNPYSTTPYVTFLFLIQ